MIGLGHGSEESVEEKEGAGVSGRADSGCGGLPGGRGGLSNVLGVGNTGSWCALVTAL